MEEFDRWNEQKKKIEQRQVRKFYREREILWCRLGRNVGFEQHGSGRRFERPVVIIKRLSKRTYIVLPLTTSEKSHPLRLKIRDTSTALLSQIRVVDSKRFLNLTDLISKEEFELIKKAIRQLFE